MLGYSGFFIILGAVVIVGKRFFPSTQTLAILVMSGLLALSSRLLASLGWPEFEGLFGHTLNHLPFPWLFMNLVLPVLLFAGTLQLDGRLMHALRIPILILALIGTLVASAAMAVWAHGTLGGIRGGVSWSQALVLGVVLAPTDPIAILALLKRHNAPSSLSMILAGESLWNDAVGIVLFDLLATSSVHSTWSVAVLSQMPLLLLRQVGGAVIAGLLTGFVLAKAHVRWGSSGFLRVFEVVVVLGLNAYVDRLHASGPLAVIVSALFLGRGELAPSTFWHEVDERLNQILFAWMGLLLALYPHHSAFTPALILLLGGWFFRLVVAGLPVFIARKHYGFPKGSAWIVSWGGLRGALALALIMSMPHASARRIDWVVLVVYMGLLVQGFTFPKLLSWMHERAPVNEKRIHSISS